MLRPIVTSQSAAKVVNFILALAIVLSASLAMTNQSFARDHKKLQPKLTLTGTGTISGEPDVATVSSGVVTHAKTAAKAVSENNKKMRDVFKLLEEIGIERKHIQTSNFSVQPRFTRNARKSNGPTPPPTISDYEVRNTVIVKVVDLDKMEDVLGKLVDVGSNELGGINFQFSNRQELLDQARAKAVQDVLRKAKIYEKEAGFELGSILTFNEGGAIAPRRFNQQLARATVAEASPVPVSAGERSLSVSVTITWEILD